MKYQVSVVVVSYNPIRNKLLHTIEKIIAQRNISVEIIICDDGSTGEDYLADVEEFLKGRDFRDYTIIKSVVNVGTVKNLYNGLLVSKGEYVFMASPGDYFYDGDTLKNIFDFTKEQHAQICYGDIVPYSYKDGRIKVLENVVTCLRNNNVFCRDADLLEQRFSVVMGNYPIGACVLRHREYAIKYIGLLCERSRYSEDISVLASSIDGIRIYHYCGYVVWYEYGVGQSTANNPKKINKLFCDVNNTLLYLGDRYPKCDILKFRQISDGNKGIMRVIKLISLYPYLYFLKKKLNRGDKMYSNGIKVDMAKF